MRHRQVQTCISDMALKKVAPDLYKTKLVTDDRGNPIQSKKED